MRMAVLIALVPLFLALLGTGGAARAQAAQAQKDTTAAVPSAPQANLPQANTLAALLAQDSAKVEVDSTAAEDRFVPTSQSFVRSSEVDIALGSRMDLVSKPGGGWALTNSLMIEHKRYRTRNMEDVIRNFANQAMKVEPGIYKLDVGVGTTYSKKKTLGLGRYGQDIVFNNESANVRFDLAKPVFHAARSLLSVAADGRRGTNDFKYDKSLSGSMSGTLLYSLGDLLNVSGGFGTARKRESSDIGEIRFGAMPSSSDTIRAGVDYGRGEKKLLEVNYRRSNGIQRKVTPPLGNAGEVLADPTKAKREEAKQSGEEIGVRSSVRPFSFLAMDIDFSHSVDNQKYKMDQRQSQEREATALSAAANYLYARSGSLRIVVSTQEDKTYYGPFSLSSFREREHRIAMGFTHKLNDSLSVTMNGTTFLKQRFYLKRDQSPRDADYLYYHGDVSIKAAPFPRIGADVVLAADRYETVNIDRSISGDNRVDYQYRVAPTITMRPAGWATISQEYSIKIEFTDFVYTEDNNYLNRTTTLNTKAGLIVLRPLTLGLRHSYLMKDTGSYLMRAGGRRYSRSNENLEHSLFIDMTYQKSPDFLIRVSNNFRNQRNNTFGVKDGVKAITGRSVFESGGMRVGFERKKRIGEDGSLDLKVAYVRNYGQFITEERKKYWDVNSAITLRF